MKKQIAIIILAILLLASVIQDISAATTVFLTSDNIMGTNDDADMLNSIKTYIEEISNGKTFDTLEDLYRFLESYSS